MAEERTLTQERFNLLLSWLDANDEVAARKYEAIRQRLVRIFSGRGCYEAEILTDLTFDRVTLKVPELNGNFVGDPAVYFYGVANKIHLEWLRQQKRAREAVIPDITMDDDERVEREAEYRCLEHCLAKLGKNVREMMVEYYSGEKAVKIDRRKALARKLGISIGALQIKTSRVRALLLGCLKECMAEG